MACFLEKFQVERRIGSGAFGDIYEGRDLSTGQAVAIKIEEANAKHPQLIYEAKLYRILSGCGGVPCLHGSGTQGGVNVLVMDLMGPSLEDLFRHCGRKFSLKTVLMLADQMITRLEYMHSRKCLHRDVKPDNFLVGLGSEAGTVHIIDFGLVKNFKDKGEHIPYREGKAMVGTPRYASVSAHLGFEQGRRDDLEALGYVLMYFLRGELPWQGEAKEASKKISTRNGSLTESYPSEFAQYFEYVSNLRFQDEPDYAMLKQKFQELFRREGFKNDGEFDWTRTCSYSSFSSALDYEYTTPGSSLSDVEDATHSLETRHSEEWNNSSLARGSHSTPSSHRSSPTDIGAAEAASFNLVPVP